MTQLPPVAKTQIKDPVTVSFEYIVSFSWGTGQQGTAFGEYDARQYETTKEIRSNIVVSAGALIGLDVSRTPCTILFMDFRRNVPVNEM